MASTLYGLFSHDTPFNPEDLQALQKADTRAFTDLTLCATPHPKIALGLNLRFLTPESRQEQISYPEFPNLFITQIGRLVDISTLKQQLGLSNAPIPDSKLTLHAYQKWGQNCVKYLKGEYLFVLFNARENLLFAANSPFSVYGLVYQNNPQDFRYASLFPTLKASLKTLPDLNPRKMADYLALTHSQPHDTFYKDIFRLPAGYTLTVRNKQCNTACFWTMDSLKLSRIRYKNKADYAEHLNHLLHDILKDYLRSDFPVGAHISGGLDSSSIAAICAQLIGPDQTLYGFGSVPGGAVAAPARTNWMDDDSHRMEDLAAMYPNIRLYKIPQTFDHFSLKNLGPYFYQQFDTIPRNPTNFGWLYDIQTFAETLGVRSVLIGGIGNATFSWKGRPSLWSYAGFKLNVRILERNLYNFLDRRHTWAEPSSLIQPSAIKRYDIPKTSAIRYLAPTHARFIRNFQEGSLQDALSVYQHQQSLTGCHFSDPTSDLRLIQFLLSIPDTAYEEGDTKRWLIREALKKELPPSIRDNKTRGSQNVRWLDDLFKNKGCFDHIIELGRTNELLNSLVKFSEMENLAQKINAMTAEEAANSNPRALLIDYQNKFLRAVMLASWVTDYKKEKGSVLG